ncbi:hypothetical protein XW81_01935 [Buchnera aphidicola (Schlechtendalia chinensis)]|uniref:Cell division protein FtsB n=1 Tax=Buchnera aphidicola subsp. Schlechtendalia chinensis TaxID=118110 RepID=A0A172WDZ7_BUCSC|nr:septum formation initiator family protein [Buchnera aphidicola]ANF17145.1 hypothetical protein XW81_01935 [Buchnera aphidicola (Schlechtendalia chinensis)]
MVIAKISLIVLFFWLQVNFFIGKNGLYEYVQLYNKNLKKEENILNVLNRNKELLLEIQDWNTSDELKEEFARSKLGMIKKGETFYRIV